MKFVNKVSDTLNKTGQDIKAAANKIGDISSLNAEKAKLEEDIAERLSTLGQTVYENRDEHYQDVIQEIDSLKERISEISLKLDHLKGVAKCPVCGQPVAEGDRFCPHCGAALSNE